MIRMNDAIEDKKLVGCFTTLLKKKLPQIIHFFTRFDDLCTACILHEENNVLTVIPTHTEVKTMVGVLAHTRLMFFLQFFL